MARPQPSGTRAPKPAASDLNSSSSIIIINRTPDKHLVPFAKYRHRPESHIVCWLADVPFAPFSSHLFQPANLQSVVRSVAPSPVGSVMVDYDRSQALQAQVNNIRVSSSGNSNYMSHHHRTSPHLSHLDQPSSSTPSTPSPPYPPYAQPIMSNLSQQNAPSQQSRPQPTSYPSPHSYPSPSVSAYAYPPPQQQQAVEPYRASPTGSHVSLPSLNLPPIRHINDPRNSQSPAGGPPPAPPMGSPLPLPGVPPPMSGYYAQSLPAPPHAMNVTSSPHHQPLRYPLPQPDGRIMSGGRHKKEIKRRTKTGCLTCRKRRIKVRQ